MSEEDASKPNRTYADTVHLRRPSVREAAQRMRMEGAREAAGEPTNLNQKGRHIR